MDDAARVLEHELRQGDVLLTLGAGDVDALAGRLAK
jgi:UDP-N-acetylmuramate-alanine ligase